MAAPEMVSPNVIARLVRRLAAVERRLAAFQSATGTLGSAFVGKGGITTFDEDLGARMFLGSGLLKFWADYPNRPDAYGLMYVDQATLANLLRFFPPHDSGTGLENSATFQGRGPDSPGAFWIYTDGDGLISSDGGLYLTGKSGVHLDSGGQLELFNLPSLGSSTYQVGYNFDGSKWSLCLVSSGEQFKDDVTPVTIDAEKVLAIEPVTFRSKDAVAVDPNAPAEFGVIAQQLHDIGVGPLLVSYVDDEPVAVQYDRIGVALVPVVKSLADENAALKTEVASMKDQLAAMAARLDALEAK